MQSHLNRVGLGLKLVEFELGAQAFLLKRTAQDHHSTSWGAYVRSIRRR